MIKLWSRNYNRADCCGERLNNVDVIVYNARRKVVERRSVAKARPVNMVQFNTHDRFVRLQLKGKNYLSLAEVMVFNGK